MLTNTPQPLSHDRARLALLLLVSVLATPYIHNYDLVIVAPVILWCWRDPEILGAGSGPLRRLLLIFAWILPWAMIPLHQGRIILAPFLLTALALLLIRAIWRRQAAQK